MNDFCLLFRQCRQLFSSRPKDPLMLRKLISTKVNRMGTQTMKQTNEQRLVNADYKIMKGGNYFKGIAFPWSPHFKIYLVMINIIIIIVEGAFTREGVKSL